MDTIQLQGISEKDMPVIRNLLLNEGLPASDLFELKPEWFIKAVMDGQIVGAAAMEPHGSFGLFRSLVVRPDKRSHSIGSALVKERLLWSRGQGLHTVYLLTTTASGYFARLGFKKTNRDSAPLEILNTTEFKSLCPSTADCFCLSLDKHMIQ